MWGCKRTAECSSELMAELLLSLVCSPEAILFGSCSTVVFKCKPLWSNLKYSWEETLFPILKNTWNLQKIFLLHAEMDWQLPKQRRETAHYKQLQPSNLDCPGEAERCLNPESEPSSACCLRVDGLAKSTLLLHVSSSSSGSEKYIVDLR